MVGTGRILGRHRAMHGSWLAGSEARSQSDHPIEASLCAPIKACLCWLVDGGQTMSSSWPWKNGGRESCKPVQRVG